MKKYLLFFIFFFNLLNCFSQNRNNIWYFGDQAGINFNTNPPTATTSAMHSYEASSAICDNNGNLLFYTNGDTVWNRNHVAMQNGIGLLSGSQASATQGVLIVPKPCDNNIYYIFTVPENESIVSTDSTFFYSIVDIRLDGGLGAVTIKNSPIHKPMTEKLTATLQANNKDYWIVVQERITGNLLAYSLTAAGLDPNPVISTTGTTIPEEYSGYLKFSHDGTKLCTACDLSDEAKLLDFDRTTGVASNIIVLPVFCYGIEFSPDNTKLYLSSSYYLYQYNLSLGSSAAIVNSQIIVASSYPISALKLGPDNKIYVEKYTDNIAIIDQPDQLGTACNFIENFINFSPYIPRWGLPNSVDLYPVCSQCAASVNITVNAKICSGQTYQLSSGITVNSTGTYQDTIRNQQATCDSIINTIHIIVNDTAHTNQFDSIYAGQTYTLPSGAVIDAAGIYQSVLVNSLGCDSVITTTLKLRKPIEECIRLNNAFTPNGDGINDYWILYRSFCFKKLEVNVYNRYGSLVYHSSDYKNDWMGTYKNKPVPDGTYYCVIKLISFDNKESVFKNNVTILR